MINIIDSLVTESQYTYLHYPRSESAEQLCIDDPHHSSRPTHGGKQIVTMYCFCGFSRIVDSRFRISSQVCVVEENIYLGDDVIKAM